MLQHHFVVNPFSKNYSTDSILKRNFEYISQKNNIKNQRFQVKIQKQNKQTGRIFENPFQKSLPLTSRVNPLYSKQYQNNNFRNNSFERSKFQSFDRNRNYKGLAAQNYKNEWKRQIQKSERQKLKNWGAQALRYQPSASCYPYYNLENSQAQSFNNKKRSSDIMNEYYGQTNQKLYQDQLSISQNKRQPTKIRSIKKRSYNNDQHQGNRKMRAFDIQSSIPQSADEDIYTRHDIVDRLNKLSSFDSIKEDQSKISMKRSSIQRFKNSVNGQSSSSGFYGTSNDMYQSGPSNFKLMSNKKGPLNASEFDQQSEQQDLYNSPNFNQPKFSSQNYPTLISHNERLYFKIQIENS